MAEKVIVTGGSGRAGEYIIAEFASKGYDVYNVDSVPPRAGSPSNAAQWWDVDVTDFGEVVSALTGADAVVHMAAIPAPNKDAEHKLFRINMLSNWNVLEAAEIHGTPLVLAGDKRSIHRNITRSMKTTQPVSKMPTRSRSGSAKRWLKRLCDVVKARFRSPICVSTHYGILRPLNDIWNRVTRLPSAGGPLADSGAGWVDTTLLELAV